jgi:di/tricarboxylate transporter
VFLVLLALPFDLEGKQQALAAVWGLVVVWWITEAIPIPVTGIIGLCLCVILNVASADEVFGSVADSTIFLFIGSFIIAEAMLVHGLDRRFAFNILALRWVGNSTWRIIAAFGFIGAATSPFMSNTGAAAMMLPIALGVMASVGKLIIRQVEGEERPERLRFGAALMLVITYGITVGGLLLPIGSPPNLIGRALIEDQTGEPITFFEWFLMALNWNQAAQIDWGTILLFGAGIALGSLMRETGLAKTIGEGLANALNVSNLVSITIISVVIAVIVSETTSNTASAAIVVPIAIAISAAVQVDPVIPAMAAIFGANYGFMLPVSTPPNAIVYSSGMLPITRMVKTGARVRRHRAILCVVGVAVMAKVVGLA